MGISGGNSVTDSFPRAGIEYDCNYSTPGYQVFYGWDRGSKYSVSDVQANAGDVVSVAVQWVQSKFVITIDDSMEGWRVYRENSTFPATPTRADAEWMIAAVSVNGPNTPLTNFAQVLYTNCYASNGGTLGTMGSFSPIQYTMVSNAGAVKARPVYGGDGTSFSIQWISPGP